MTDAITAWFIATVWMAPTADDVETRTVVRLPATDVEDYQARVRAAWPAKVITFGPISLAKVQADA